MNMKRQSEMISGSHPPTTLSSGATAWMKIILPFLWIGGFGAGTLALFLASSSQPDTAFLKWEILVIALIGTLFFRWLCMPLKVVRMDDTALYVSNYLEEITIPLQNISAVTEVQWIKIHPVTIHFHAPTDFGLRIKFMPKARWFDIWATHPVVAQITTAAAHAAGPPRF